MPECPQRIPDRYLMTSPRSAIFAALAICATFALTTATGAPQAAATGAATAAPIALAPAE